MLIIRGINVFPSQIESVILSMPECAPYYRLIIDRQGNLDTLTVQVEVRQEYWAEGFDTITPITALEKKVAGALRSVLSISAIVQIKAPGTIERCEGKTKFVQDNRILK